MRTALKLGLPLSTLFAFAFGCADTDIPEAGSPPRLGWTSSGEPVPFTFSLRGARPLQAPDGTERWFEVEEVTAPDGTIRDVPVAALPTRDDGGPSWDGPKGEVPDWALAYFDLLDEGGEEEVSAGPLCGTPGVYEADMMLPYTTATVFQDTVSFDVEFAVEFYQETTIYHPPGGGQDEARHTPTIHGSLTGFRACTPFFSRVTLQ